MDSARFAADDRTNYAVVRALEINGEATKNISSDIRDQYPDVPWTQMAEMRAKLIHDYFGADLRVVWRTLQEDLPLLRVLMAQILADLSVDEAEADEQM